MPVIFTKSPDPNPLIVAPAAHPVFYRATQVQLSIGCYGIKVAPGLKCAILRDVAEFKHGEFPTPRFCTGIVARFFGDPSDPMMEFVFDDPTTAGGLSQMCSVRVFSPYMIPIRRGHEDHL